MLIISILAVIGWSLIWSKVLVQEADGWFSSCPNCWGDWMAHLTYTSSFAFAHNWPLQLPVFVGHKFTYPFVIDLISAGLVKLGLNLPTSLVWPGLILSLVLTYLIYLLAKTLTGNRLAAIFTTLLFLFNNGWVKDTRWLNFITSQIIPQRGQLLGLSLSIIVYLLLWRKKIVPAGIVAGLLPLMHAHSYLVTMMIGGWYGWKFILPALVLGLPQIAYVYGFSGGKGFIHWDMGWLKVWWQLGPIIPVLIWGLFKAPKKLKRFFWPFWLVFLIGNFFRFQPYDWDNTKLFLHWYLIASIGAGLALSKRPLIGLAILLILIFPGVRAVAKIYQETNKYQFFNNQQLAAAEKARQILPAKAVVITASNHNHWLAALTGRQIVMGYPGWLWSYGIDYSQRQNDIDKIYQGNFGETYGADYLVIGPDERQQWPNLNEAYFKANFPLVLETGEYQVFKLK
ncbi:MAG: hypothetical protein AAB430_03440 [Patescibacteria group bacterium]